MSVAKRQRQEKKERERTRRRKPKDEVSWFDVDTATIVGFVQLAERLDGAVRFGRSRDGSVYSLGFYVGEERFTEWIRGGDDAELAFAALHDEIVEDFEIQDGVSK